VRASQSLDDHCDTLRFVRHGDVPDFLSGVPQGSQQIDLVLVGVRQRRAVADPDHLRAAGLGPAWLSRNVREVLRGPWIRDVENRRTVVLVVPCQRIAYEVPVMTDVRNPASALPVHQWLVRTPAVQIVIPNQLHVPRLRGAPRLSDDPVVQEEPNDCEPERHACRL